MTMERFLEILKEHNFNSVHDFLDLRDTWERLSPEIRYKLIRAEYERYMESLQKQNGEI